MKYQQLQILLGEKTIANVIIKGGKVIPYTQFCYERNEVREKLAKIDIKYFSDLVRRKV